MTTQGPEIMTSFSLRAPNNLVERIRLFSNSNRRSMNSQIIVILEQALPAEQNETAEGEKPASTTPTAADTTQNHEVER